MTQGNHLRSLAMGAALAIIAMAGATLAAPASAQEQPPGPGDPYGGTTTTAPGQPALVRCFLEAEAAFPGETVTVRVVGVEPGSEVRLLLAGTEVARGTAPVVGQSVGAGAIFGGPALPAQSATTELELSFVVPALEPGTHRLHAVGARFTVGCGSDGTLTVLGTSTARGDEDDTGPGSGALPRTGLAIGLLVALALALLVLGRLLQRRAARQRRRTPRGGRPPRARDAHLPA